MSNDRKTLIRLAATLEKGSDERRVLLAELQKESRKVTVEEMKNFIEIAWDHKEQPSSSEASRWLKRSDVRACVVCGSSNTGRAWEAKEQRGYNCFNCGAEYSVAIKIVPTKVLQVEYDLNRGNFRQQPVKGSQMYDGITYND